MPTYEFKCQSCETVTEIFTLTVNTATAAILAGPKCPDCGGSLERILSAGSFHLKGSGWAKDGYSK